jgi:hypothetical protein
VRVCQTCYNNLNSRQVARDSRDGLEREEAIVSPVEIAEVQRDPELTHQGTLMSIPTDWSWSTF